MQYSFGNYCLDTERRELRRGADLVDIEPQVFDIIKFLIENRERVVSKDDLIASIWAGRIVSNSTLTSRINAARTALGDSGAAQTLIRTIPRKGFRFVGVLKADNAAAGAASPQRGTALRQQVHFCTSADGVRIAYAEVGSGPPLVKAANWLNHLEYDWQSPIWSHLLHELAATHRLVRYDARGNGLSDWNVPEISFDKSIADLKSVVDAAGLDRFDLFGISQGCAVSVAFASLYPERVRRLVLYGGYARGRARRESPGEADQAKAFVTLIRQGWGQANPAFRQLFTSLFIPDGSQEQRDWFNDLQRMTTSPENAASIRATNDLIDVTNILPQVRAPTLVMHCRDDAMAPFDEGRRLAAGIPGARFVALEGRNHLILETDSSWSRFMDELRTFVRE